MKRHKIYVTNKSQVSLTCPHCGVFRPVSVSKVRVLGRPVKARCTCGRDFTVEFERRTLYRKAINFPGSFQNRDTQGIGIGDILIEDISRGGLMFRVIGHGTVEVGDVLDLQFRLDDADQTPIRVRVVVRHVEGGKVGCQFVNLDPGMMKTISFYVLP